MVYILPVDRPMVWRHVIISRPAHLSIKNGLLSCVQEDRQIDLSFEDLASVTLEVPQITMTQAVLSWAAQHGTAIIACDDRHHPCGLSLPMAQHSRFSKVTQAQVDMSYGFKGCLWQDLIRQKILNQDAALRLCRGSSSPRLQRLANTGAGS